MSKHAVEREAREQERLEQLEQERLARRGQEESDEAHHARQLAELDEELHEAYDRARQAEHESRHYQSLLEQARKNYEELRRAFDGLLGLAPSLDALEAVFDQALPEMEDSPAPPLVPRAPRPSAPAPAPPVPVRTPSPRLPPLVARAVEASSGDKGVTQGYVDDLLGTVCRYGPVNRVRLSLLSGKSRRSSTFAQGIRVLLTEGLAVESQGELASTPLGKRRAKMPPLPLGRELFEHWKQLLAPYDQANFVAIAHAPSKGLTRTQLNEKTGHSKSSSTFSDSLRRLKAMGLCEEREKGYLRLPDHVRKAMFG